MRGWIRAWAADIVALWLPSLVTGAAQALVLIATATGVIPADDSTRTALVVVNAVLTAIWVAPSIAHLLRSKRARS